ncbi:hypothetical protein HOP50_03g24460 [Chloropicon primus]|uniref:Alpha-(1,6)-fucosyltransferase N- and catalytic domain-containing protein n=1 Tax=Chloropicon primus TaxID=1764295 RepID=A0A5B8MGW5_9CHLO|nr:hypothetical protein A3770_03p24460 [Chloropicon primus]UPQ99139.1 hypothetical protein HOP50_03g24460 [Chloropicon primus]|eukprot:QDZ19928.1 hypothetical protein A3770_03p24460 [Chloropicon primus]
MRKVRFSVVAGSVLVLMALITFNMSTVKESRFTETVPADRLEVKEPASPVSSGTPPLVATGTEEALDSGDRPTTHVRNVVNKASKVVSSSGGSTSPLLDSKTHGYYKDKSASVCTDSQKDPWFEVDLGGPFTVRNIELWAPKKSCESIKFKGRCERLQDVMIVTKKSPMKMEVLDAAKEVLKSKVISSMRTIYAWDSVEQEARYVRISINGEKLRVCATEVKVLVADDDFKLCDSKTCKFGSCKCMDKECAQKKCLCNSDMIGEHDCTTNPLQDWRYFPLEKTAAGGKSWNWDAGKVAEVTSGLQKLQNPKSCAKSNGVHGLIGAQGRGAGLASTLHFVSGHLSEALRTKKPFVFGGRMNYAGTKFCKEKDMYGDPDCYFKPVAGSSCLKRKAELRKSYRPISGPKRHPNRCAIGKLCNDVGHFRYLPKDFEEAGMGLLHFRSAIVSQLVQINNVTEEILNLDKLKADMGFQHPIIGVHIRHGDACHTTDRKGRCKGLSYYIPEIRTLAERYNTTRVFISTDDDTILKSTKSYSKEFNFVFAESFSRDVFDSKDQIEYRKDLWSGNNNKGHSIMLSSLIDLLLLAECDYLVLHLLSNMSRLALELAAARKEAIPPYFSMDGPWCQHWKMCTS